MIGTAAAKKGSTVHKSLRSAIAPQTSVAVWLAYVLQATPHPGATTCRAAERQGGEPGRRVVLANAQHTTNVPGRKSDVQECQWLMKLHTYGLLRDSFRLEDKDGERKDDLAVA